MNQNQPYYDDGGGAETAVSHRESTGIAQLEHVSLCNSESRSFRKIAHRAEVTATQEQFRAGLTGNAIVQVGKLSHLGDIVIDAVPSSAQAVRGLVSNFAISTGERIARWQ